MNVYGWVFVSQNALSSIITLGRWHHFIGNGLIITNVYQMSKRSSNIPKSPKNVFLRCSEGIGENKARWIFWIIFGSQTSLQLIADCLVVQTIHPIGYHLIARLHEKGGKCNIFHKEYCENIYYYAIMFCNWKIQNKKYGKKRSEGNTSKRMKTGKEQTPLLRTHTHTSCLKWKFTGRMVSTLSALRATTYRVKYGQQKRENELQRTSNTWNEKLKLV